MATSKVMDSCSVKFVDTVESSSFKSQAPSLAAGSLKDSPGEDGLSYRWTVQCSLIFQRPSVDPSHPERGHPYFLIYSDNWIDEHLPSPDGNKKSSSKFKRSSFKTPSVSLDSSERSGMCKDVRLSMGEELPVMQEVVCGDASLETNPLEDSQAMDCTPPLEVVPAPVPEETVVPSHSLLAEPLCPSSFSEVPVSEETVASSHSLLAEASCPSSFSGVPMSEEIAVPSHSLLAEASCPSTSTVVQNDGSIVVTTESIVMVDSPVDKSSSEVSRKRKTDVEISTSSSKMLRILPKKKTTTLSVS